jgi:hypothetical protein
MEALCKGGQSPVRAVMPRKKKEFNNKLTVSDAKVENGNKNVMENNLL